MPRSREQKCSLLNSLLLPSRACSRVERYILMTERRKEGCVSFGPHEVKAETQCHLTMHAVCPWTRLYFFPIIFSVQWQALIWTDKKQHPFSLTHFKRSFFQLSFDICLQKITGRDYPCFHLELSSSDHSAVCFPWLTRPGVYSSPYREAFILSVLSAQMWTLGTLGSNSLSSVFGA